MVYCSCLFFKIIFHPWLPSNHFSLGFHRVILISNPHTVYAVTQFAIELPCLKPGLLRPYICLGVDINSSCLLENFPNSSWARGYFRGNPWTGHQHRFGGAALSYDIDRAMNGINNVGVRLRMEILNTLFIYLGALAFDFADWKFLLIAYRYTFDGPMTPCSCWLNLHAARERLVQSLWDQEVSRHWNLPQLNGSRICRRVWVWWFSGLASRNLLWKGFWPRNLPKKHSEIVENQQPKLVDGGDFYIRTFLFSC